MEWRTVIVTNADKFLVQYERRMSLPVYTIGHNRLGKLEIIPEYQPTKWYFSEGIKSFYTRAAAEDWLKENKQRLLKGKNK